MLLKTSQLSPLIKKEKLSHLHQSFFWMSSYSYGKIKQIYSQKKIISMNWWIRGRVEHATAYRGSPWPSNVRPLESFGNCCKQVCDIVVVIAIPVLERMSFIFADFATTSQIVYVSKCVQTPASVLLLLLHKLYAL